MTGYIFEHEGKQYDPNGRVFDTVANAEQHNHSISEAELSLWAQKPDRFVAYVSECERIGPAVTTWRGITLGKIIDRRNYRNNLTGTRMEYVRVCGFNGATYYGTYGCDWSQAVRLRKAKP